MCRASGDIIDAMPALSQPYTRDSIPRSAIPLKIGPVLNDRTFHQLNGNWLHYDNRSYVVKFLAFAGLS